MDIAGTFKPKTILLWRKIAQHAEAQRIVGLFPSARVHIIDQQKWSASLDMSPSQALLAGKRTLMIGHTSSFVGYFDGQPILASGCGRMQNGTGCNICCLPYYKLVPISNGCPYYCTYCYLAFVYRKYASFIKMNINYDTMFKQIRKTLARTEGKICFNMGEMLDSLALDHITNLTTMLIPFFSGFSRAYLMLLTKSKNVDNLLAIEPNGQTVVSWTLNSQQMIETFELGTASLDERIGAARLCQKYGYRIRFRIDPGILYPGGQAGYADLIQKTLAVTKPENITLGMLRFLPGHFRLAAAAYGNRIQKLNGHKFVKGASDGKLRYLPRERIEFYNFLIDIIRSFDKNVSIGLCRETPEIWDVFKGRCSPAECNCMIW
jgi:spore photoproduct lyase